jgi:8-oxo-dGTP diphosphatase
MPKTDHPLLTVRAFVKDQYGRILLLKRANSIAGNGRWVLPGGKVDYLQSPEESIVAEVKEETGLSFENYCFLFYQNSLPGKDAPSHSLILYFEGTGRGKTQINRESSELIWVSPGEALKYDPVFHGVEAISRYIELKRADAANNL